MRPRVLLPLIIIALFFISLQCTTPVAGNGSQIGNPVATVILNTKLQNLEHQTPEEMNSYKSTSNTWTQVGLDTSVSQRGNAPLVSFKNKLWIIGGSQVHVPVLTNAKPTQSDVWSSPDGKNWTLVSDSAPFGPRRNFSVIEYQGALWLLGGYNEKNADVNDVWSSTDGITWKLMTATLPWSKRGIGGCIVFNARIWVIGTADPSYTYYASDVWSSSDGITWEMVTDSGFPKRNYPGCVVFKDKMWVIGGANKISSQLFDVWNSSDGKVWQQIGYSEAWTPREGMGCFTYDNKMWLVGGSDNNPNSTGARFFNDVWFSVNGVEWNELAITSVTNSQLRQRTEWPARERLSYAVFNSTMYCGFGETVDGFTNDLWKLECK